MKILSKILAEAGEWLYSLIIACALALVINVFIFHPTTVLGQSMEPTLRDGQYIILSRLGHTLGRTPTYNDIVVIDSRVNRNRDLRDDLTEPVQNVAVLMKGLEPNHNMWVKRVVGLPGDTIEFKNGKVYRNNTPLDEAYIKEPMQYRSDRTITVPTGHVFVLGDNRNNSSDSRYIGSVPVDHVMGVMVLKL